MFKFTKSGTDLGKLAEPIQYKVLCDWLRNISNQNIQLKRQITLLQKSIDFILNEDSPRPEEVDEGAYDNSSNTKV